MLWRSLMCLFVFFFLQDVQAAPTSTTSTLTILKAHFQQLVAAEKAKNWDKKAALTKQLAPTLKDVAQVLSPLGFKRLQVATFELDMKRLFGTKKQQIKMLDFADGRYFQAFSQATTERILKGEYLSHGRLNRIAEYLKPGVTWVRCNVFPKGQPYTRNSRNYQVFAYVQGRWVLFPELWKYVDVRPRKPVTLQGDMYKLCHSMRLSNAMKLHPKWPMKVIASWGARHLHHPRVLWVFRALDAHTWDQKVTFLRKWSKSAGLDKCPLSDWINDSYQKAREKKNRRK